VKRCLDPALERELEPVVFGCRPGANHTIFHNAALHIGQEFVARFDLKNFFPSIRVDAIVPALLSVRSPIVTQTAIRKTADGENNVLRTKRPWTHDVAVLVARLATRRGRLPQGAPTSPAIANLVFRKYDRRIIEGLGSDFVYSRYVDDLAVSLSSAGARRLGIKSAPQMRSYVETRLTAALDGSGFALNQRKTRVTVLEQGHRITGIRVTENAVELTRSAKRDLRSLVYNLRKLGFLRMACNRVGGEIAARTCYREDRVSHFRESRRLSTERLAVLMLKKCSPDIHVEVRSPAPYPLRRRGVHDLESCEGPRAWKIIERVLTHLWTGKLSTQDEEGHLSILEHDGSVVCRIRSDSRLDFFQLSKREAIACVELWHELRGRVASLTVKDTNRCFDPIRQWRSELAIAIDQIEIRALHPSGPMPEPPTVPIGSVPLTPEDDILDLSRRAYENIGRFHDYIPRPDPDVPAFIHNGAVDFHQVVSDRDGLKTWVSTVRRLCIDSLSRFPASLPSGDIFKLLQVLDDRFSRRRGYRYKIEEEFLNAVVRRKDVGSLSNNDECRKIQAELLRRLQRCFETSLEDRATQGRSQWTRSLHDNLLRLSLESQLEDASRTFHELHVRCAWPDNSAIVFYAEAARLLANMLPDLQRCIAESSTSSEVWRELFSFGKQICDVTTELLECPAGQTLQDVRNRFNKCLGPESDAVFRMLYRLRNRAAHPLRPEGDSDWRAIQHDAARRIGIRLQRGNRPVQEGGLFGPEHLQLTSLEGNELKVQYLQDACKGLRRFGSQALPSDDA
jgi:hypothetical protein